MGPRLVRIAAAAAERFADQGVARENARVAATDLARGRVDRLEVEHFLENHAQGRRTSPLRAPVHPRAAR
jgi:hypothetical protein